MSGKKTEQSGVEGRRGFLRLASVGALATGVAAVTTSKEAEAKAVRKDGSLGYQETDHVMKSYELARF